MPTYEYRCPSCGVFEVLQRISEKRLQTCPDCGEEVKKLISKPTVIFNGSGFYTTDYANGSSPANGSHDQSGEKSKEEKTEKKESKEKSKTA